MGVTFDEAIDNKLITEYTLKLLPSKCRCGANIEFNDSIRNMRCTNDNCIYKIIDRLHNFCTYNNITINNSELLNIAKTLNIITPYQLLMLDEAYEHKLITSDIVTNIDNLLCDIAKLKNRPIYLYEMIAMCGLTSITNVAEQLFNGFDTVDNAFNEIEQGQLTFINERLGVKDIDNSIFSMDIYKDLVSLKEEFVFAETQLKIIKYSKVIKIAFCDNVLPFYNKRELIKYLDSKFKAKFNHVVCINDNVDILVKSFDSNNTKTRLANAINDKYRADMINSGKLEIQDLDKFNNTELKPVGKKIYIDNLDNLLNRLEVITDGC